MGNGQAKGWSPTGVVTIVLTGGRTEEFKRPILAGDIMLRHPRHHVVRPDFFRASPVVVLKPEDVLMPGHKFLLIPFHTVYKKVSGKVRTVSPNSSTASSAASAAGGVHPRLCDLPGGIRDTNNCTGRDVSVCTQSPVRIAKKDLAGAVIATRSPAGRASGLRRSSPTTSLQPRKTLPHKEVSRNARKRHSGDSGDFARMRTSLQSRTRRDGIGGSSAEFTENEISKSSDLTELQSFRTTEFAECNSVETPVTQQALSRNLSLPEYESFQTSLSLSREFSFETTVFAVTQQDSFMSPKNMFNPNEAMGISESDKRLIEPFLPTSGSLVKKLVQSFEAMDSSPKEKISREPISPKTGTLVGKDEVFEAMDSSGPKKSSREPTSLKTGILVEKDEFFDAMDSSEPKKSSREPIISPKKPCREQISSKKNSGEPISPKAGTSVEQNEVFEAMDPSEPEKSSSQPPLRMPSPLPDGYASFVSMKERMHFQSVNSGLGHQTRKEDLSRFNKPPWSASSMEVLPESKQKKLTIKMAGAADAEPVMSHSSRQLSSRLQSTPGLKQVVAQKPKRSSSGRSERSERSESQHIQQKMENQAGGLKGLQQVHKGAGDKKFEIKPLENGSFSKSSQVAPKPLTPVRLVKNRPSSQVEWKPLTPLRSVAEPPIGLAKQRKPYRQKLVESLCFSSSGYRQSPLHVQVAAGNQEKQIKKKLKLIDHLKIELSPPPRYVQKLYQQSPLHARTTRMNNLPPRHRRLPMIQSGSGSRRDSKAQKHPPALQPNQATVKFQLSDPSVLPSNNVFNYKGTTSIEEKFLKFPSAGLFRHRKIRPRRRVYALASWKPRLSPLVELSP